MSASPVPPPTAQSQKRPLDEPSSDGGFEDQHDSKRPALGIKDDGVDGDNPSSGPTFDETIDQAKVPAVATKDESSSEVNANGNGITGDAPSNTEILETQPIQSMATANGTTSTGSPFREQHVDETGWLHIRAIISGQEAATLIGKGGENVNLIRRLSGAKCTVSEYSRGAVERILTVSGHADAIAKVSLLESLTAYKLTQS